MDFKILKDSLNNKSINFETESITVQLFQGIPIQNLKRKDIYEILKQDEFSQHIVDFWSRKNVDLNEKNIG